MSLTRPWSSARCTTSRMGSFTSMSRGNCKSLGNLREGERSRVPCGGQLLTCAFPGRRFQQIMHYHMQHEQYRQVITVCERHGEQEPSLWEQALSYFARKEEDCKEYVAAVLKHIESKNLMPPLLGTAEDGEGGWVQAADSRARAGALQFYPEGCLVHGLVSSRTPISVVQTLAHNSTATLSVIRDYLVQKLQKQSQQIAQDELRVRRYREETTRIRQEIQELKARYLASRIVEVSGDNTLLHRVSFFKDRGLYGVCLSISFLKI